MPKEKSDWARRNKSRIQKTIDWAKTAVGSFDKPDLITYPVIGVDTSIWTGLFDWEKFKSRGGTFGILKALDGTTLDPWFIPNYLAAKRAGVIISAYQWLYSRLVLSPVEQAKAFVSLLKDYPVDFFPWIDYEKNKINPSSVDLIMHVNEFEQAYGSMAGIYSGYYYIRENGYFPPEFGVRPLWMGWFGKKNPPAPLPWLKWNLHQFTDRADGVYWGSRKDGEAQLDMNYFDGSKGEFLNFCNLQEEPPSSEPPVVLPPIETEEDWFDGKVKYKKVKLRDPRLVTYHLLSMDIKDIKDVVVDARYNLSSTTNWMKTHPLVHLAVNGPDQFSNGKLGGFASWHGITSIKPTNSEETVYVDELNHFFMGKPITQKLWTSFSVPNVLIRNGVLQAVAFRDPSDIRARTALGLSRDGTRLYILTVDGGDYAEKKGMTFLETAKVLQSEGCWWVWMCDGGNSTTMVKRNMLGAVEIVNEPNGENPPDANGKRQRSVAQHFGIQLKE